MRKSGAYLRRGRDEQRFLPHVLYLAETRPEPDSPAALYAEDVALNGC